MSDLTANDCRTLWKERGWLYVDEGSRFVQLLYAEHGYLLINAKPGLKLGDVLAPDQFTPIVREVFREFGPIRLRIVAETTRAKAAQFWGYDGFCSREASMVFYRVEVLD